MILKASVCVCMSLIVSACAFDSPHSVYPVAPKKTTKELIAAAGSDDIPNMQLAESRLALIGLHNILEAAAGGREKTNLIASELLYYGTLVAVLGVTLDSRAARNAGAAVGAGAELFSGHYHLSDQQVVFEKALARVDCGRDAIAPMTPAILDTFPSKDLADVTPTPTKEQSDSGVKDAATSFAELPQNTLDFVNKVQSDLKVALSKVVLSAPSKDDLNKSIDTWNKARAITPGTPGANENNKAVAAAQANVQVVSQRLEGQRLARYDLQRRNSVLARVGNKAEELSVVQSGIAEALQNESQLDQQLSDAKKRLQALEDQQAIIKAQQSMFVRALYAYKANLDLCLQQHQQ